MAYDAQWITDGEAQSVFRKLLGELGVDLPEVQAVENEDKPKDDGEDNLEDWRDSFFRRQALIDGA